VDVLLVLLLNALAFGSYFFKQWKDNMLTTERLQKETARIQFDNLKNQLNPHFLFNSLTSLNSLIYDNQDLASQFLQQLSKVFRYTLQNKENGQVSLETELNFVNHYVFLMKTRFGCMLDVEIDVKPETMDCYIPPVTLQILIENAVKHNVINECNSLVIRIYDEDKYLVVSNNIKRKSLVATSNKTGLANLVDLYAYLSDKPVQIVDDNQNFAVRLPLLQH
jgi:two-component system, LytTR family, sensor kinase